MTLKNSHKSIVYLWSAHRGLAALVWPAVVVVFACGGWWPAWYQEFDRAWGQPSNKIKIRLAIKDWSQFLHDYTVGKHYEIGTFKKNIITILNVCHMTLGFIDTARFDRNPFHCQKILQDVSSCQVKVYFVRGLVAGIKVFFAMESLLKLYYRSCKNMPKNSNFGGKYFRKIPY